MNALKFIALLLITAGVGALVYGGFTYTSETHKAELGPVELEVAEKDRVSVPPWMGIASIGAGTLLLLVGPRRSS